MAMTVEVFFFFPYLWVLLILTFFLLSGFSCFALESSMVPLLSYSACRASLHVFSQHLASDSGMCSIQQLVANVISIDVCFGAHAMLVLRGGSTQFLTSRDGGGWIDAAKFLTGASAVGSIAIPMILHHADLIATGAMFIELTSFFIFVCTVLCFHRATLDDEW